VMCAEYTEVVRILSSQLFGPRLTRGLLCASMTHPLEIGGAI